MGSKLKKTRELVYGKNPSLISKIVVSAILLAVLVAVVLFGYKTVSSQFNQDIRTEGYQWVVLENGERFAGKLSSRNGGYVLKDIYYVQAGQAQDAEEENQPQLQLTKRGTEIFGPIDGMFISADSVTYWENIKDDSELRKAIDREKSGADNGGGDNNQQPAAEQPATEQPAERPTN